MINYKGLKMAKIEYDAAREVVEQASMKEQPKTKTISSSKKKLGRPIQGTEGATEKIMLNVTPTEKKKVQQYAEDNYITIAGLIKSLLSKEKII